VEREKKGSSEWLQLKSYHYNDVWIMEKEARMRSNCYLCSKHTIQYTHWLTLFFFLNSNIQICDDESKKKICIYLFLSCWLCSLIYWFFIKNFLQCRKFLFIWVEYMYSYYTGQFNELIVINPAIYIEQFAHLTPLHSFIYLFIYLLYSLC
jgi:hypothetical protein